jgi:Metallo-peptidase family M12
VTDSVGHVTLGAAVAVETPSEVFTLWPDRPGFDATFTREMFYADFAANPGSVGHADVQTVDNRVTSARVVLKDVASARLARVIAHELGHTFGAGHPPSAG